MKLSKILTLLISIIVATYSKALNYSALVDCRDVTLQFAKLNVRKLENTRCLAAWVEPLSENATRSSILDRIIDARHLTFYIELQMDNSVGENWFVMRTTHNNTFGDFFYFSMDIPIINLPDTWNQRSISFLQGSILQKFKDDHKIEVFNLGSDLMFEYTSTGNVLRLRALTVDHPQLIQAVYLTSCKNFVNEKEILRKKEGQANI